MCLGVCAHIGMHTQVAHMQTVYIHTILKILPALLVLVFPSSQVSSIRGITVSWKGTHHGRF